MRKKVIKISIALISNNSHLANFAELLFHNDPVKRNMLKFARTTDAELKQDLNISQLIYFHSK